MYPSLHTLLGAVLKPLAASGHTKGRRPASSDNYNPLPRALPDSMALVFGREESGLSQEELALCAHCCQIPASQSRGSLNLSHAVAVALSQLYQLLCDDTGLEPTSWARPVELKADKSRRAFYFYHRFPLLVCYSAVLLPCRWAASTCSMGWYLYAHFRLLASASCADELG